MFFSKKSNGNCTHASDHAVTFARSSATGASFTSKEVGECLVHDRAAWSEIAKFFPSKKSANDDIGAVASIAPAQYSVRRTVVRIECLKESEIFAEVTKQQRVEPSKFPMRFIPAPAGADFDIAKAIPKDALFSGPTREGPVVLWDCFLPSGVCSERGEFGSVALLGARANYLPSAYLQ